jgi:hypothetical protein
VDVLLLLLAMWRGAHLLLHKPEERGMVRLLQRTLCWLSVFMMMGVCRGEEAKKSLAMLAIDHR